MDANTVYSVRYRPQVTRKVCERWRIHSSSHSKLDTLEVFSNLTAECPHWDIELVESKTLYTTILNHTAEEATQ